MELDTTFYVLGGVLVATALIVSYIGIRGKDKFPPNRAAMVAGLAVVGAVVIATGAYAVALAREEKEHRDEEQAHEEAEATEEVASAEGKAEGGTPAKGEPAGGPATSLDVSSPEDGSLDFEPPRLAADAGTITITYDNPSLITHNIFLQDSEETVVTNSDDVAEGSVDISAELPPGEYFYYCDIPGHREGGMEGTLTVQ
jgi:plastocyanin